MKKQTRLILIIGALMQLLSYFMPFMREEFGYKFFEGGIDAFFREGIRADNWYLFFAFFSPIIFAPMVLVLYFKDLSEKATKFWRWFFFMVIIIPTFVTVGLIMSHWSGMENEGAVGYVAWSLSFCLLYAAFYLNREDQLMEENFLARHLINDE